MDRQIIELLQRQAEQVEFLYKLASEPSGFIPDHLHDRFKANQRQIRELLAQILPVGISGIHDAP